jgi:asparagine synthase (glutamine-hydrolysing)
VGAIIGKFSFDPQEPLARPVLEQMLDASLQRAASRDLFAVPGIALGACGDAELLRRDSSEFRPLHLVADASITNAALLRCELERLGHRFAGFTAVEVIQHAYDAWGTECFTRLRGPFACAIWDGAARRLIIARDHLGIRPLYFAVLPNHGLVFATDIRALLQDPGVSREWCSEAIDAYLAVGYVPAPLTAYRRVSKLEAAHVLIVEGHSLRVERYWDLPAPEAAVATDTTDRLSRSLHQVMTAQAADGRVSGLLYSGGVGSTTLLASLPEQVSTIVSVDEQDGADLARSDRAAAHLGFRRDLETADPQVPLLAQELAAHFAEPIADPAAVSQLALCMAARRHTDCAFSATGAATLWAGHARHRVERVEMTLRAWLAAPLAAWSAGLARPLQDAFRGARALSHLALPPADAYAVKHAYGLWDDHHRRSLYTRGFAWEVRDANPFARHLELYLSRDTADPIDRALYVDAHTFLADSELIASEHAAAAAGMQLRYPMLDPALALLAGRTPGELKQRAGRDMYALRLVLARALPRELMPPTRRRRAVHAWLEPALSSLVPAVLLSPRFDGRGIVSRPALRGLWEEHRSGRCNHGHRLWSLLMLEFWFRDSIDGDAAEEPEEYAVLKAA